MRGKIFAIATVAMIFASLLALPRPAFAQTAQVYLTPASVSVDIAATFTLQVWVQNVADLYAYELKIKHPSPSIAMTFITPPHDSNLLGGGLYTTYFAWTSDPAVGTITVGCTRLGEVPGYTGSGKLLDLVFKAEGVGAGKTWIVEFEYVKLLDSTLNEIPQLPTNHTEVTISYPTWLLNTELYLSAAKGGKIWTEWQTGNLLNLTAIYFDPTSPYYWPDPYWLDYPWMWPPQTVYCRVRNAGTAPVEGVELPLYISVRVYMEDTVTGWIQATNSKPEKIWAGGQAISTCNIGPADLYYGTFIPWEDFQQYPATWLLTGRLRISLDGYNFSYWDTVKIGGVPLPGDGFARDVPGGSTGKFKVLPP